MDAELSEYLSRVRPACEERVLWDKGRMRLRLTAYITSRAPPLAYVTSVRAIVLRGNSVLAVRDSENTWHILPGGRREPDETPAETLAREVLEETGWTIRDPALLGVLVFHHLSERPRHYAYPYPEFVQLVYRASAFEYTPAKKVHGEHEWESAFRPVGQARRLGLPVSQQVLLNAALAGEGL